MLPTESVQPDEPNRFVDSPTTYSNGPDPTDKDGDIPSTSDVCDDEAIRNVSIDRQATAIEEPGTDSASAEGKG